MMQTAGPRLWDEFGWNDANTGSITAVEDMGIVEITPPTEYISTSYADPVAQPEHYNHGDIEAIVYMQDNMSTEAFQGYLEGCAKKYMHRFRYKGKAKQDLQKAQWYLNRLIGEIADDV